MKRTFVDTFFVVALVNKRDYFHQKAVELSIEYDKRPVLTSDAVLLEISNSLARTHKKESIIVIEKFLSTTKTEVIRLDESLFNKAFELYKIHADKTWGLG